MISAACHWQSWWFGELKVFLFLLRNLETKWHLVIASQAEVLGHLKELLYKLGKLPIDWAKTDDSLKELFQIRDKELLNVNLLLWCLKLPFDWYDLFSLLMQLLDYKFHVVSSERQLRELLNYRLILRYLVVAGDGGMSLRWTWVSLWVSHLCDNHVANDLPHLFQSRNNVLVVPWWSKVCCLDLFLNLLGCQHSDDLVELLLNVAMAVS